MPSQLKNGVQGAMGGKRKGAGRIMNWQKKLCDDLIHDRKLIPRLAEAAAGGKIFTKLDMFGNEHAAAASDAVQVMAFEKLADRAWGKARQEVEHTGLTSVAISDLIIMVEKLRAERGLDD